MNYFIKKELLFGANNYKSLNVCIQNGKGVFLYDTSHKKYFDFLSGYSAVNQGHCHPRILKVLISQACDLTLTSRAFHNNKLGDYMEFMCNTFKYDKLLPTNTGVEAGETAIKIARKWGYEVKNISNNQAKILFSENNFWGRSIAACSSSSDPLCYNNFGPYLPGIQLIPYNNIEFLELMLKNDPNIVAYMVEPIQGEAGIIIPDRNYLKQVKKLCEKYNVLMIADEIQTGLGRTGKLLACDHELVQPDILCLGKALSGGTLPISAVLTNDNIMNCITPGTHGSTFGGSPLASAVAMESVKVILEENMIHNSFLMGNEFRLELKKFNFDFIKDVRGKGLFNAIEFRNKTITDQIIQSLMKNGLLCKSTHDTILRLSPPLIINETQIHQSLDIIHKTFKEI